MKKGAIRSASSKILLELTVDDRFTLQLLELLHPPEIRHRLPNGGWRKVSLRILIALIRSEVVRVAEEC